MALGTVRRTPRLTRALLPLGLVFLAVGISTALVGPFLSLFLSTEVDAGPLQVTVFLVVAPLSGVLGSTLIGRLSDRRPIRRRLLVGGAVAGMIGCALTAVVRDYWVLLGLTITAIALANSLFPQSFAYARQVLERDAPDRAAMGISGLRTVFSLAWVAGPPLAAFLLDAGGFVWVYGAAALMYALAAAIGLFGLDEVEAPAIAATPDKAAISGTLLLTAAAFTLMQTPLTLAVQALPLYIRTDLGGDVADAGLVLGLCAALEIPLMLGLGAMSTRMPLRVLLLAGAACGIAYYGLVAMASSVWLLFGAQILNALFIAAVSGLGITYMQNMLPGHPGRATTLFTNSFPLGAMLAGPLFGVAQHFGYRHAYVICTVLCAAGLLLLTVVRPPSRYGGTRARTG
ncbi:sugar efflux transporter [Actinoplanes sp. NPDC049681]|uniref:sugar efflux transporter n=1 Tax=Actinoplanes sp. NPDC049681 TaxID=3363905 RepID=UPI0037BC1C41